MGREDHRRPRICLRCYDLAGAKQRARSSTGKVLAFKSKTDARKHFTAEIAPRLRGDRPDTEHTLATFVPVFLERHVARGRTIDTLRERLAHATAKFGDVPLRDLENLTGEIAAWYRQQPEGCATAAWPRSASASAPPSAGRRSTAPRARGGRDRQPAPREIGSRRCRARRADRGDAADLHRAPTFAAATGLRTEEWAALDARRDIDCRAGVVRVTHTVTGGKTAATPLEIVELGKTDGSRPRSRLTPARSPR